MISVIIPTYNEEKNIERCLHALEYQTIPRYKYEIIVVDGHSKDKTVELAKKYADKVILQRSEGVSGARNDAILTANGNIIAMTDADCIVPKEWIERITQNFDENNIVMLYGPLKSLEQRKKYKILLNISKWTSILAHKTGIFYPTVGANTAFKKDVFLSIGGYNENFSSADDYEMAMRIKKIGKIHYDKRHYIYFSMRRMEKMGVMHTVGICIYYPLKLILGLGINDKNYNKIIYG